MITNDNHCYACGYLNPPDEAFCTKCGKTVMRALMRSRGKGLIPSGFLWPLFGENITIGTSPDCNVMLIGEGVEEEHCTLNFTKDAYYIKRSANCPEVKMANYPLSAGPSHRINDSSGIFFGEEEVEIIYLNDFFADPLLTDPDRLEMRKQVRQSINHLGRRALQILNANHSLCRYTNSKELLEYLVKTVLQVTGLDRCYAFRVINDNNQVNVKEICAIKKGEGYFHEKNFTITRSIMSKVLESTGSVFIEDSARQSAPTQSMIDFKIKTVVCLPLTYVDSDTKERELIAIIYADKSLDPLPLPEGIGKVLQVLCNYAARHLKRCLEFEDFTILAGQYGEYLQRLSEEMDKISQELLLCAEEDKEKARHKLQQLQLGLNSLVQNIDQALQN